MTTYRGHLGTFGAEGGKPPWVNQTTIPQKICLKEIHVFVEAAPLQKCPFKKLLLCREQKSFS